MTAPWRLNKPPVTQKRSAIIAGAGAIAGAWAPVLKALQSYYDFPLTIDGANSFLARVVYLLRWYALMDNDFGRTQLKRHLEFTNEIKSSIARELRSAQEQGQ